MLHIPSSLQAQQSQVHLVSTHSDHRLLTHPHYVGEPRRQENFIVAKMYNIKLVILSVQIISINLIHSIIGLPYCMEP